MVYTGGWFPDIEPSSVDLFNSFRFIIVATKRITDRITNTAEVMLPIRTTFVPSSEFPAPATDGTIAKKKKMVHVIGITELMWHLSIEFAPRIIFTDYPQSSFMTQYPLLKRLV